MLNGTAECREDAVPGPPWHGQSFQCTEMPLVEAE